MSDHEVRLFEANFNVWRNESGTGLLDSKAFERYVSEQVLKDFDLSSEEMESGDLGGGDDGGVDACYLFMNKTLIRLETDPIVPAGPVELHLIQAKYENGFKETTIEKLESFAKDMFSYDRDVDKMTYLNSKAKDAIKNFREKYNDKVMGNPHTLSVTFHYGSKAANAPGPNEKISARAKNLVSYVQGVLSSAEIKFTPWPASKLLEVARTVPNTSIVLPFNKNFTTSDKSVVCLVGIKDYAEKLLSNSEGQLQTRFFEPNVRDYNGKSNPVNKQIRDTLGESSPHEDFWWLNNGITILADSCPVNGDKLTIGNPEVVNGLQTSHEIFEWYKSHKDGDDKRNILVRVIVAPNEKSRSKIIKATNSQTSVSSLSLMSTDEIQEDIEDKLKLYNLFYDRKKGEYKRLKKPIAQIVGIGTLAQAVIAIALMKPDEARARPETFVKKNKDSVFDANIERGLYVACILIDRQVIKYLQERTDLTADQVRDIRFYVSMLIGQHWNLASKDSAAIKKALADVINPISTTLLQGAVDRSLKAYTQLGGTDKEAKSPEMRQLVLEADDGPNLFDAKSSIPQ